MLRSLILAATMLVPLSALAQGTAGPYLSARVAGFNNDYADAGRSYGNLLKQGVVETQILENALIIYSVLGDFGAATNVADLIDENGGRSQFSESARLVVALRDGQLTAARSLLEDDGVGGPLLDGLLLGWLAAAEGDEAKAIAAFDTLADIDAFSEIAWQHKGYLLALNGDMQGADDVLSGRVNGPLNATERGIAAHAQIMAQLGRADDAIDLLQKANAVTNSPLLTDLSVRLEAGEDVPFDLIRSPTDGMAEAFFVFAALLAGDSSATFTLMNARASVTLRPDHVEALVLVSQLLEAQNQMALAADVLAQVPADDPAFYQAEINRAEILLATDQEEAGIGVLKALTEAEKEKPDVWAAYATALNRLDRFDEAVPGFDRAIDLLPEVTERNWVLFYSRAVSRERSGDWTGAEVDFRRALELTPENPNVLNYLGYGLVEQRMKLDEALDMIERAVAARPDDGFITDSLAWVLYRLGRYDEAVEPMERAVLLAPLDPLINDHLGDVFWKVDRKREARFQWRRALSLEPKEQVERIKRKLEVGLDVVLEEEGGVGPIKATD